MFKAVHDDVPFDANTATAGDTSLQDSVTRCALQQLLPSSTVARTGSTSVIGFSREKTRPA